MLQGKKIVLGITGSIAAYKSCLIIRQLIKKGAEVQVVITPSGKEFITPITLSALTSKPVISEFFSQRDGTWHSHVDLGLWADAMLIAPATAATIGKMANGIADNMLITTYLSMKAPVFVAPAMDLDMYAHPSTQQNLKTLQSYGNYIIEPGTGFLASKLEGKGRMEEPENIVAFLEKALSSASSSEEKTKSCVRQSLTGKKVLITAGPTYEKIDPVRFIGNYSSGKMGYAIAEEAARRGANVTIVSGPVSIKAQHPSIKVIGIESARQMHQHCTQLFPAMDIAIMCAAVADYAPAQQFDAKIKREKDEIPTITLVKNPDIAADLGKMKTPCQKLIGFALETNDEEANAQAKLAKKNLDAIVLNSLRDKDACFGTDTNKITIFFANGNNKQYPLKPKAEVAKDIIDSII
jgi:phosphopantothenoylcysteine decarboxylase/phosphopantothenate--cysteine ligase